MSSDARLYLLTPRLKDAAPFAPMLRSALASGDVACVLARLEAAVDEGGAKKILRALIETAQPLGVALIVEDNAGLALKTGADGVHISGDEDALQHALKQLKPGRIVGAGNLRSRDAAMSLGETGVDYLMFGEPASDGFVQPLEKTLERVDWWASIFTLPCVAYAGSADAVDPLAAAHAEFIALGEWLWDSADVASAVALAAAAAARNPLPVA